jgi:hypothetical protein
VSDEVRSKIDSFVRHFGHEPDGAFYSQAMDFIIPRHQQIDDCRYEPGG